MARATQGKYDAVLPGLPKMPVEDPSRQEKIDRVKEQITNRSATLLAQTYGDLRLVEEKIKLELAVVSVQKAAYEQLLAESQEAEAEGWGDYGVKKNAIRLPSGDTIRIQREPQGKVEDREAFRLWCIANGYERQMQLMWQTMNGIVKERLLEGVPEPDGCKVYSYTKVVYTPKGEE